MNSGFCTLPFNEHHNLSSDNSLLSIVNNLMVYSVYEDKAFSKRAIESLVKKLKDRKQELDSLILTITTSGQNLTNCVTISRTLDNRLQIAGKKGFPHVFYAKVWRWPDVHRNDLQHLNFCKHPFNSKSEFVCVNPYHYERTAPLDFNLNGIKKQNELNLMFSNFVPSFSDNWCSIKYFEFDKKVGETFIASNNHKTVIVDGYTNLYAKDRFCLGALSNMFRNEKSEKVRLHIGKGICLSIIQNGDVYLECLSDQSVFVKSSFLDLEINKSDDCIVHKLHKSASVKVFDLEKVKCMIKQDCYDENYLKNFCILRLSFVKGWGLDYIRKTIEETPCWIEIQLNGTLKLIEELLISATSYYEF